MKSIRIGTAGWSIPRAVAEAFPHEGTALQRYAARFNCAEINSSFHRPHQARTWAKWADSVPAGFRFSAKLPKVITHQHKLIGCEEPVKEFLDQVTGMGEKLAVLLVQLPPKLAFEKPVAEAFFARLAEMTHADVACEPRNASWFTEEADELLRAHRVCRVAADPALCAQAGEPGGWRGLAYWRLHGSPVMYRSSYADRIGEYAEALRQEGYRSDAWCIFDNTASSAATGDALGLVDAFA